MAKPGPQSKGGERVPVRYPEDHRKIYETAWRAKGYTSLSDYTAAVMASAHGLPSPSWLNRADANQQTLLSA